MKKLFLFMAFLTGMNVTVGAQTASDEYLDVTQYSTIDAAGWETTYVENLYWYEEYPDAGVAWLTMAVSGAYFNSASWVNHSGRNQAWITLSPNPELTGHSNQAGSSNPQFYAWGTGNGLQNRSATHPFMGSNTYFGDKTVYVYGHGEGTFDQKISFYVTNSDQVQVYLRSAQSGISSYPSKFIIYEYEKNNQSTLVQTRIVDNVSYNSTTTPKYFISSDLDVTKIYRVELTTRRGRFAEIAFRTPLNPAVITAAPTSLSFSSTINTSVTKTVNVKGVNLKDVINATVTNTTGNAFSISGSSSVSIADASSNDGGEISVTFNPDAEGNYAGTLMLTTTSAQRVEIPLNGEATSRVFTVKISTIGLSTLYFDEPLAIPYDNPDLLGVFYIYGMLETVNEKGKNVTEMRAARLNSTIPANTGVIVQGNSGSYNFPVISEADPLPESRPNSLLSGCLISTPASEILAQTPGTIYTLGRGKDSYINFFPYTGSNFLQPYKAYYLLPASTSAKSVVINFDDAESEVTGINAVDAKAENGAWYSIQGIQLQGKPATKGIYIHNGKAVIVK